MRFLNFILIIFLFVSCQGIEPSHSIVGERCFPIMKEISSVETLKGEEQIVSGFCQCHKYKIGDQIKRVSDSYEMPLMYCNKEATFKDWSNTYYLFLEEWRVYLIQNNR